MLGMRCYRFYLPAGSVMDTDKAYCNYAIEDALRDIEIMFKPGRKKNAKRQYPPPEVYLHQSYRKRVEVTKRLVEKLLPKSIHAVTAHGFELKLRLFLIATNIKMRFEDLWQLRLKKCKHYLGKSEKGWQCNSEIRYN